MFLRSIGLGSLIPHRHVAPRLQSGGLPLIDVAVYVSDAFSLREMANIVNGVVMWERATSGAVSWSVRSTGADKLPDEVPKKMPDGSQKLVVMFHKAHSSAPWIKTWDNAPTIKGKIVGLCAGSHLSDRVSIWLIIDRLYDDQFQSWTAAHELGHALGLSHVTDTTSLMSPKYNWKTGEQTRHDIEEFCKVWDLDASQITKSEDS